jgi:hypothetical protein
MVVGRVRAIPNLSVEHVPLPENRAHTEVFGKKDVEARVMLLRASRWVIPVRAVERAEGPGPHDRRLAHSP